MKQFWATVKEAANTAVHAIVAGLASSIPANIFTSWDADEAWLIGAGVSGLVAAAHYIGKALQNWKPDEAR